MKASIISMNLLEILFPNRLDPDGTSLCQTEEQKSFLEQNSVNDTR